MTEKQDSEKILRLMRVQETKTYVLGCFGSRLTFSSQQYRAFNLIWAMFDAGCLKAGDSLAIVGAGLAGITAAAAAIVRGVRVTIFEQASQPMGRQRGNFTRYIHPNILDWPRADSRRASTKWDILNWQAAPLHNVVSQIDEGWSRFKGAARTHFRYQVGKVYCDAARVHAAPLDPELPPIEEDFDAVILAVGFGVERTLENIPVRSYWLNDDLHQETGAGSAPRRVLVTGCGDGGLIDVLRLRLTNFDHARFVSEVLDSKDMKAVRTRLLRIESEARSLLANGDPSSYLVTAYRKLPFNDSFSEQFRSWLRLDTHVVLNGPLGTPVTIQASILHRYIVFLLWSGGYLEYRSGKVLHISGSRGDYHVSFETPEGNNEMLAFDEVVVRHGPDPVVQNLIPRDAVRDICERWRAGGPDVTLTRHWPRGYFRTNLPRPKSSEDESQAAALLNKALAALRTEGVASIRVDTVGDRIGYVVTPSPQFRPEARHPKIVLGFPVDYRIGQGLPRPRFVDAPKVLRPGALVYCDESDGKEASTVGCFVLTKQREMGFLTTSHGFVPRVGAIIGTDIYQTTNSRARDATKKVGRIGAFITPTPSPPTAGIQTAALNSIDIALGILSPGVIYNTRFEEEMGLPPLVGLASPRRGDRVFKVGGRSGLTYGTVTSVSAVMVVSSFGNPVWLQNSFTIEPEGSSRFSAEGDSGSLIVRGSPSGGLILGVLVGSDRHRFSYALPLQPALDALDCSPILKTTFQIERKRLC